MTQHHIARPVPQVVFAPTLASSGKSRAMTTSARKTVKDQVADGIQIEDAADEAERAIELTRRAVLEQFTIDNLIEDAAYPDGYDGWPISGKALAELKADEEFADWF